MKSRAGRTIHPFRLSGRNEPGYSQPKQQPFPTPQQPQAPASPGPQARSMAPQHPQDAKTLEEAAEGMLQALHPRLMMPRFTDTSGPWVRVGDDQVRVPRDVIVRTTKARDGRIVCVVAHLDSSVTPGRVQVLVSTADGVRELVGIAPEHLAELRRANFGR